MTPLFAIGMEFVGIIITAILFVASLAIAYAFGYKPHIKQEELDELQKRIEKKDTELLALYRDIHSLIQIESNLCNDLNISKTKARDGFTISHRCEPQRINKRIAELELKQK